MSARAVLHYDADCPFCEKAARALSRWDLTGRLRLEGFRRAQPYDDARPLTLVEADGTRLESFEAVRRLTSLLPALWWAAPCAYFPGSRPLWERCYSAVTRLRYGFLP